MLICYFRFLVLELITQFYWTCQIVKFLSNLTERTIEFVSNLLFPLSNKEFFRHGKPVLCFSYESLHYIKNAVILKKF
jgi:hypothetical protein